MKKFLKFIKFTFLTILSLFIIFALYFYISGKIFLESKNQENVDYLKANNAVIKDSINGKLFDKNFYDSQVFLLGEIHGFADNQIIDRELFFFLNKKIGIRYYISEMDSITAKKLNNFLSDKTKNETILKEVVVAVAQRIPQQSSRELFDKWDAIYDYNQKLPDSSKITVIGIDKNFDDKSKEPRDLEMIKNFKNAIQKLKLENEKFYGLFGFYHVLQSELESGSKILGVELKKAGFKTISFVSHTVDSEMYLPKNPQFPTPENEKVEWGNADGPLVLVKGINDIKEVSKPNSITLFKLNSENSPYFKSQNLVYLKSRLFGDNIIPKENAFATDYFQYVFLLRNSKALSKMK
ncbi:hypothetical protein [Flavobacterium foetidum]|uniref:hypothetical protein n=1 Tax=Flavobacterium foetidum TaxID=2026681 RepID=UPI001075660C|nr:hypothetical protein [Flavobacterium foetidum]KAF2513403.1 hypothetical protein E0W73_14220 [Flavobacterium foetidum]